MKIEKGRVQFESEEDLLPVAMSVAGTSWNRTGSWKYLEPYYQDLTPPCVHTCLVGNDIVTFMRLIDEGRYEDAARAVLQHNPFPATLGRVCPHPCETPCNRKFLGGPIMIQYAERFLGDFALKHGILPDLPEMNSGSVVVVGAGPAGLSAAYFLRKLGYAPLVLEAEERAGGLLWSGIPPFRLSRDVLSQELERFSKMGIVFRFEARVGKDIPLQMLLNEASAVLLAIGLTGVRSLNIPGEDHPQVFDGIEMLHMLHEGKGFQMGHRVAVIGGGNTALDCARSLLRLGHEVTVVYRRSKAEMPAFQDEIQEAEEEGITFEFLTAPLRILPMGDNLAAIECIRMKLLDKDDSGRPKPIPVEGSQFCLPVDAVVKALGETLNDEAVPSGVADRGFIRASDYHTAVRGLFACGDCLGSGGTVAQAIATGREAAYAIHAYRSGTEYKPPHPVEQRNASATVAEYDQFSPQYFKKATGPGIKLRSPDNRVVDFSEVRLPLTEQEIRAEAARCFKCGTCNLCDNCKFFCPDNAIVWKPDGSGYQVLYEYCKGCLVCVEECPRSAIHSRRVEV